MKRLLVLFALTAGCSSTATEPSTQPARASAASVVLAHVAVAAEAPRRDALGFHRAPSERLLEADDLQVNAPATANGPLHFEVRGRSIDVAPRGLHASAGHVERGLVVYDDVAASTDLVHVLGRAAAEEFRVLRDAAAPTTFRYAVSGGTVRVVDGRIDVVDASHRTLVSAAPPVAFDAHGTRRALGVRAVEDGFELALDTSGLAHPIVVDPAWTALPAMSAKRSGHAGVLLADGRALMIGGYDPMGGTLASCEIFDPKTNTWSATGSLWTSRGGHAAARMKSGSVFAWGGDNSSSSGSSTIGSAEVWNPATGTWKPTAASPSLPYEPVVAALDDGRVLGTSSNQYDPTGNDAWVYNPSTGGWTTVAKPSAATGALVKLSTGEVLLVGANNTLSPDLLFNPTTNTWSNTGTRSQARMWFAAVLLPGDQVLVAGGRTPGFGGSALATAELYTHATKSWKTVGSMKGARSGGFGAPLGKLALVGGGSTADAELFDPATGVFSAGTSMVLSDPRTSVPALAIAPNEVLVAGGDTPAGTTAAAEVFIAGLAGQACTAAGDCASGYCVDGVCCDKACTDQCEACDVKGMEGTCVPITGAPHGVRPRCPSGGTNVCATKTCDGTTTATCAALPSASTKCSPASCDGSSYVAQGTCDGAGTCTPGAKSACGDFSCDPSGCKTSCMVRADCAGGLVCIDGKCVGATAVCTPDGLGSKGEDGQIASCTPFRCTDDTGQCAKACAASSDCAPGFACDPSSAQCVSASPAPSNDSGGCAYAGAARTGSGALVSLLFAVSLVRRRRRADRRDVRSETRP